MVSIVFRAELTAVDEPGRVIRQNEDRGRGRVSFRERYARDTAGKEIGIALAVWQFR
jgi:hypothetical protein